MAFSKTKEKYLTVAKAIDIATSLGIEVSRPTLVKWIHKHKLGFQLGKGGKWYIYKNKFSSYIHGDSSEEKADSGTKELIGKQDEEKSKEQQQERKKESDS